MGGIVRTLGGVPEAVGGVSDHVHLMVGPRDTHSLSDGMRELKSVSSRWVHETPGFSRLRGRKVTEHSLRVSRRGLLSGVTVANQEEHHRTRTFREEYLELLQRHGVEFDSQ